MSDPRSKIAKLLALATRDTTPDGEALNAFRAAFALATKHGIAAFPASAPLKPVAPSKPVVPTRADDDFMETLRREQEATHARNHQGGDPFAEAMRRENEATEAQQRRDRDDFWTNSRREAHRSRSTHDTVTEPVVPNKYMGKCASCRAPVSPFAGYTKFNNGKWYVVCAKHPMFVRKVAP